MPDPLIFVLSDSEVAYATWRDGTLEVGCSAASLRRSGSGPGGRWVPGFGRGVVLRLTDGRIVEAQGPALGRLADGRVQLPSGWQPQLPLPFRADGPLRLELAFANRSVLVVDGSGLSVDFEGLPDFTESLAC